MVILENGQSFDEREYIQACPKCGCKFKYKEKEVNKGSSTVSQKYKKGQRDYINCPQCQITLFVDNRGKSLEQIDVERKTSAAWMHFISELIVSVVLLIVSIFLVRSLFLLILGIIFFCGCITSLVMWICSKKHLESIKEKSGIVAQ